MMKIALLPLLSVLCLGGIEEASAADFTAAVGVTGQKDTTFRVGVSFDWDKSWLGSSAGHMTGYWDAGYTYWHGGSGASSASSLSFAPVFVYEFNGEYLKPFIEIGVGVAGFSNTHVGEKNMGSSFNFEDRLGAGVKFSGNQKVGVRVIHYSNAGISQTNEGIESYSLFYSIPL